MTDTPESRSAKATAIEQPSSNERYGRPSRLGQAAAWVVIVAGVVFVVAVIFFAGVALGRSSSGYGWHRDGWSDGRIRPDGMMGGRSMMESGGMPMRPGDMGPMRPMSPSTSPTATPPSAPRP